MRFLKSGSLFGDVIAKLAQLGRHFLDRARAVIDALELGLELRAQRAHQGAGRGFARSMQDLIGRVQYGAKELQLLAQDVEGEGLRLIVAGNEVDDGDGVL